MKLKKLLTKSLLVAVCLLVGASNAWADDVLYSWEGGTPSATETGGTVAVTGESDALNTEQTTIAGTIYAIRVATKKADIATTNVTITLNSALQKGDVIKISGFQNKDASDKTVSLYLGFKDGDTDKGNISDVANWVNLYNSATYANASEPEIKSYAVTPSLAGSNKLILARNNAGTNLFISKIEVIRPTKNADIDFGNAISEGTVSGAVNSMSLSNTTTGSHPYEVSDNMLRVGNGTGTVIIPDAQLAGSRDEVVITFDMYFGHLTNGSAGFYLYDNSETPVVIGGFYYNAYNSNASLNSFGLSLGDSYMPHAKTSKQTDDNYIKGSSYKNTFEIHLNYATGKMFVRQYAAGLLKQTSALISLGTNPLKKFVLQSNYGTDTRRCWFDNLLITTIQGATKKTITYAYQDNNENDISALILANGGLSAATPYVGDTYTPEYPSSVTDGDYAYDYTYTSGGAAFTVTDDATITLVYTKGAHPTTDVTVQYKYGETVIKSEVVAEDYPEGKPLSYGVNQYVLGNDGVFYTTSKGSNWYYRTQNAAATLTESLTLSGIDNVIYFTEAEKVANVSSQNYTNRASNGQVGYTGSATTYVDVTTLNPGKYIIYVKGLNGNNADKDANFKLGDNIFEFSITQGTNQTGNSLEFTISEPSTLSFGCQGASSSTGGVDWIYVVKTGERFDVGEDIITNGSFATNTDGWTLVNYKRNPTAGQNSTPVVESWNNAGRDAGSVTQSVGYLPTGNYVISASVLSGAEAYLKVLNASDDSEIASIECTGSWYDKTVAKSFTLNEVKDVKVQFSTPAQAEGTWWSYVTNVSLIYYGSNTPVESKMAVSAPNKAKYGTFYAPYDVEIPTLIKAYTAQNNAAGTALTLTEINGTIPAYTPVILENNRGDNNTFNGTFYGVTADGSQASSALTGTLDEYTLLGGEYIMQYQNNETAFYSVTEAAIGKKIAANRCYIAAIQAAKGVNVIYLGSETTAINNANAAEASKPAKRIVNGQLVIEKNGKQYNAMGQEK